MAAPATAEAIRDVNTRYHDVAATDYDAKWGIDFGATGQQQVTQKLAKALNEQPEFFPRALEIGAGTGYFSLNLLQAGVIGKAACTDISDGMLKRLRANAKQLGVPVTTKQTGAEKLPFPKDSFDLVFGHAILHHIPDLTKAFREFARVLKPGGAIVFCGEPSRLGDRIAQLPKRGAAIASPLWRRALRASPAPPFEGMAEEDHELEQFVDVHAFDAGYLEKAARDAKLESVRVSGEELVANWFGWTNRVFEASAAPDEIPQWWRQYAFHGYLTLQRLDAQLEGRLPAGIFYNLMISGRKRLR